MTIDTKCVHIYLHDEELASLREANAILKRFSSLFNEGETLLVNRLTGECVNESDVDRARGIVSLFAENNSFFSAM